MAVDANSTPASDSQSSPNDAELLPVPFTRFDCAGMAADAWKGQTS